MNLSEFESINSLVGHTSDEYHAAIQDNHVIVLCNGYTVNPIETEWGVFFDLNGQLIIQQDIKWFIGKASKPWELAESCE